MLDGISVISIQDIELIYASKNGDEAKVVALLDEGANVNAAAKVCNHSKRPYG